MESAKTCARHHQYLELVSTDEVMPYELFIGAAAISLLSGSIDATRKLEDKKLGIDIRLALMKHLKEELNDLFREN